MTRTKRGRPKGSSSRSKIDREEIEAEKESERRQGIYKVNVKYPPSLINLDEMGYLKVEDFPDQLDMHAIIQRSIIKWEEVYKGPTVVGVPVTLPSFVRPRLEDIKFQLPAVVPMLFLMHTLCSKNAMFTADGKISVWPLMVYTSDDHRTAREFGTPVLCVHIAHIKTLMWHLYSKIRHAVPVENNTLTPFCAPYQCHYDVNDDYLLNAVTGLDPYSSAKEKKAAGHVLLPMLWFDVMKWYFVRHVENSGHMQLRDISDILALTYGHRPEVRDKFDRTFQVCYLGEVREANTTYMLRESTHKTHTFGMARARSLDQKIYKGLSSELYRLPTRRSDAVLEVTYSQDSFAYGVQAWSEQLYWLNTAYAYLTERSPGKISHMHGLFAIDPETPVLSRQGAISLGIKLEKYNERTSNAVRAERNSLVREWGYFYIKYYFGRENIILYYRNKEGRKKRKLGQEEEDVEEGDASEEL